MTSPPVRLRRAAGAAALLLAGALASGCAEDVRYRERWITRLVWQGRYDRAVEVYEGMPAASREGPRQRVHAMYAGLGRCGVPPKALEHVILPLAQRDVGALWSHLGRFGGPSEEAARGLAELAERLARPSDDPATRLTIGGLWIHAALTLVHHDTGVGTPAFEPEAVRARTCRALRLALAYTGADPDAAGPRFAALPPLALVARGWLDDVRGRPGGSFRHKVAAWVADNAPRRP